MIDVMYHLWNALRFIVLHLRFSIWKKSVVILKDQTFNWMYKAHHKLVSLEIERKPWII